MRTHKLFSGHKKEKKDSKKGLAFWMTLFIAFIMITSVFGVIFYGYNSPSDTIKYNNIKFVYDYSTGTYFAKIAKNQYQFYATPKDTEFIVSTPEIKQTLDYASGIVLTSNETSAYRQDIAVAYYILQQTVEKRDLLISSAFTTPLITTNIPAITCENATLGTPVIYFVESNQSSLTKKQDCIIAEFENTGALQLITAKLQFLMLGVINE